MFCISCGKWNDNQPHEICHGCAFDDAQMAIASQEPDNVKKGKCDACSAEVLIEMHGPYDKHEVYHCNGCGRYDVDGENVN